MRDWLGREINYLRMSLTERCDLKCIYCRDESFYCKGKHELRTDEIAKLTDSFTRLGITKIRLTGGEPLVRKDLEEIVAIVSSHPEIEDIAMTTNGQGLAGRVEELKKAGLKRLNISLDSLEVARYREMTRGGDLQRTLSGIQEALDAGLGVKVNVVVIRGKNDGEIDRFIDFAAKKPLDVRFIELMPIGAFGEKKENRVPNTEILRNHPELHQVPPRSDSQPSVDYQGEGFAGRVGFISPVSHRFCDKCNRVRLTSDGKLRMCLGRNEETDLRPYIESPDLTERIREAIFRKPEKNEFRKLYHTNRRMNQIGG
jgi:cyclic pyranopterin phosphate synthase